MHLLLECICYWSVSAIYYSAHQHNLQLQANKKELKSDMDEGLPYWKRHYPAYQSISDLLLVLIQYFGLAPGILLNSYLILMIVEDNDTSCGFRHNRPWLIVPNMTGTDAYLAMIGLFWVLSTAAAIFWFYLSGSVMRPK